MSRMTLRDKILDCNQHNDIVPLKGHFKMILEDVRDGKQEVIETDNVVTNAVQTILNHNFCGLAKFSDIFPLKNLYGGIFLFQNTQTESANNWQLQNDDVMPLIAHAGNLANNTGSVLRGSPVSNEWIESDTSIQMTWMWDNTQGVGHIASASLVPSLLGNMGIKPFDDEFSPLSTFGGADRNGADTFDEDEVIKYPFNISDDGKIGYSIYMNGTSFKEITVRHDFFAFAIMRDVDDWQVVTTRTATIRSGSSAGNRIVFDDSSYYYVCQATYDNQTSKYGLLIDKIDKSTFAVTQADIYYADVTLYTGTIYEDTKGSMRIFGFDGTYLYFPNSAGTGFVKVNITDNTDTTVIDGTISIGMGRSVSGSDGRQFMSPIAINEGLIIGSNYIINGSKAYPIKHARQIGCSSGNYGTGNYLYLIRKDASVYGNTRFPYSSIYRVNQNNVLLQMWKGSCLNLPEAKDKGSSQTMRCVYTLTEQTS